MRFELSQLTHFYEYLTSNSQIVLDAVFLMYTLYTVIVYSNIGIVNTLLRVMGYIGAFLVAKSVTGKAAAYIGVNEPLSIMLLGVFIFFLCAYLIYRQLQFFSFKSRSFIDGLLGGIYGAGEVLFFVAVINLCAIYAHNNNFPVPEWILEANGIKPRDESKGNSIAYFVFGTVGKYTSVIARGEQINKIVDWLKVQFGIQETQGSGGSGSAGAGSNPPSAV